ncbi:MAG: OmpH family outer membrane protein [Phycisphaerae bacterium]|nr:OmpH family outer membrane protein [Phycisphaerae bacterium]
MKATTALVLCGVVGSLVLSAGYGGRGALRAQPSPSDPLQRIGVVSVSRIMRQSQRYEAYEREMTAEQDRINGDMAKMSQEIEAEQGRLKAFKQGSQEFLEHYKLLLEKQARFQTTDKYEKDALAVRERQWNEQLFKEILEATAKVAEQKGLGLVLERTEPDFPIPPDLLPSKISTYKVLHAKGCVDITADVLAMVDGK